MRKVIVLSIFLFLIFPIISAVEFEMNIKFDQGETLLVKISGNFLEPIAAENVFFYRGHVRIPMVYDVIESNDDFYIYALLIGKQQANYSIVIKNTRYMKGIEISEDDLVKNFTITENTAIFSVNPGFVVTSNNFFVEVQNLQEGGITIDIETDFKTPLGNSIDLKSGESKKIDFEAMEERTSTLETVELTSENLTYQIPVFITTNMTTPAEKKESGFRFEPSIFDVSMVTNSEAKRIIYLRNTGESDLENIFIFVSPLLEPYVSLSTETIDDLEKNSSVKIEIFFLSDEEEFIVEGKIIAQTENISTSSTIILNFIKDFIPRDEDVEIDVISTLACSEEGGTICAENEECSEDVIYAKDDVCCLATCEEIKTSSTGKIIGWGILILVILVLYWFYKKRYKGVKRKVDLSKIARGRK